MSETELNIKYICDKTLLDKDDKLVPIILDMVRDSYKAGLNQSEYDNTMDLINENQELKKQLEEWKHHLKCAKEMLDVQGQNGNYNYDNYMLGLYNGMEYIIALFETREPIYINGKDIEFLNDKSQQKEFIEYLENQIENYDKCCNDGLNKSQFNQVVKEELQLVLIKYKEIIGGKNE